MVARLNAHLYDDFSGSPYLLNDGRTSPNGKWYDVYNGYGSSGVAVDKDGENVFFMQPLQVTNPEQTEAALVISTKKLRDFGASIDFRTDFSLRRNWPPNPWEVAWVFPKYVDDTHHYFFNLSSDGWEFGKKDNLPGDSTIEKQIYLRTETNPANRIGQMYNLAWIIQGNHITILLDGEKIVDLFDDGTIGRWYDEESGEAHDGNSQTTKLAGYGSIGMYTEDARACFRNADFYFIP